MLSLCFLDFSVGVRASVIGLSQISSFSLETEFMSLSYNESCIKIAYILYYSQKFVSHPFFGATFSSQHDFL